MQFTLSNIALNGGYMVALYAMLGLGGSLFSVLVFMALAFALAKAVTGRLALVRDPAIVAMAVAGLIYYVSGVLMIALNMDDAGNYELLLQRLPFLGFLPLFAQLALSDPPALRRALEQGALIGALGVGLWAGWDLLAGMPRAEGAPGNSGPFATTAAILFGICLLGLANARRGHAILLALGAVSAAFALVASGMRTLYPALIVLPLVALIVLPDLRHRLSGRWALAGLAAALIVLVAAGGIMGQRYLAFIADLELAGLEPTASSSLGQRLAMWQCALAGAADVPLFGMGRHDALVFMGQCTHELTGQPITHTHFHNVALNALVMGGLVELVAVGALLIVPVVVALRACRDPETRHGAALVFVVATAFGLNGLANITFGNDIHDALFIHAVTVGMALMRPTRS